ncbi:peroxisomal membrane protein PEX14-like [Anneissia japonica]|uniref:peroxisomal membrane protein PEX14-like n=1 Tax=Anneissia japonica TaxID=1529436 RepID=UPI001425B436|nr:peroxisomal membrane protein PEX14-like [Anneissia japonica]
MSSDVKELSPVPVVESSPLPGADTSSLPRQNLIETAVKFLQNPQVQSSAVTARKAFLIKKGLTEKEIELALERSGVNTSNQLVAAHPNPIAPPQPATQQIAHYRPQGWRGYTTLAVVVGSVAFCIYKFYQNVIAPLLRRRREEVEALTAMEEAIQQLKASVTETVSEVQKIVGGLKTTLNNQEQKLDQLTLDVARNKSMAATVKSIDTSEIKSELVSLKGLLLSRNQFPRTPKPSPIPAWQMAASKTGGDDATTETTLALTATLPAANKTPDDSTNHVDSQDIEAEQISERAGSLDESTQLSPSQVETPLQTVTDGQVKIARSLSGSFDSSISPSKILQGATAPSQNGVVSNNGHMASGESFPLLNDHHSDSNQSDDSVD